jgi:hypothetical protein
LASNLCTLSSFQRYSESAQVRMRTSAAVPGRRALPFAFIYHPSKSALGAAEAPLLKYLETKIIVHTIANLKLSNCWPMRACGSQFEPFSS